MTTTPTPIQEENQVAPAPVDEVNPTATPAETCAEKTEDVAEVPETQIASTTETVEEPKNQEIIEIQKEVAEENDKAKEMDDQINENKEDKKRKRDELVEPTTQEVSPEKKLKVVNCSQEHNSQTVVHNSQEIQC